MEVRTWRARAGGAVRLVAALATLTVPPLLLAAMVGNPLPSWPIDWTRAVASVQTGLIPSSVWVDLLAVVAWGAWVVLVGMLTIEVVAVAHNRPSPAGVPRWIRRLAQALVAAAITLAGPGQQALAVGGTAPVLAVAAAPAAHPPGGSSAATQPAAQGRMVTVAEGDSWGGFAADVLGDASLGPALRTANVGRPVGDGHAIAETTAFVEPGWQLLIPRHLDTGLLATAEGHTEADVADSDETHPDRWEVERGDHFWAIAEATLAEAWGRPPTDTEIVAYWRQVIEVNHDALLPPGDPDVVYPGQQLVVPSPPPGPDTASTDSPTTGATPSQREQSDAETEPAGPTDDSGSQRPLDDTTVETPATTDGWRTAIEGGDPSGDAAVETAPPRDGWQAALEHDGSPTEETSSRDLDEEARTALGVPVGLAAGVGASSILAAGVVAVLRWRRRTLLAQRAPGMRLPTPLPEADAEVAKLDAAAAPEETLDDLAALLASVPLDVHPVLVRATDDGQVTVLFDEHGELPDPPSPWTLADDGADGPVGWQARLGDRGPERSFGIPLLVTLGRAGTSTVLANVGAMGTLALNGSPAQVRRRLRAMSLDLATSRVSFPVEVAVAGDGRLTSLDRIRQIDDPADEVELALAEVGQVVVDDRIPRLLVCHHGSVPPKVPAELIGMVGVVCAGAISACTWVLDLDEEHTGRLRLPDAGTVRLALPDIDPDLLDDELARLDEPASMEPAEPADEPATPMVVDPSTNGHASHRPTTTTEPAWCELRLLGPVEVMRDGVHVDGLTPRTLEILVYLATHRDGVTKERLDDVIWTGRAGRPGTQRVTSALTKLRKVLGDGPDSKPLLPRRSGDEPIMVSEHVGTDLGRADAHLALGRDLPTELRVRELAAALELVRGEPLEGRAYSWATDLCQQAIVQLQDAALELARTCREAGDLDSTEKAIAQGLKLLDPNGWLYLERAQLACLRGRPEQPPRIFEQYCRKLADDADEIAGTVATPPPEIELAFRELMAAV